MEQQGWGKNFEGVVQELDGVFGADGTFLHHRLRFVDFVDELEELLEEIAQMEGGNKEVADGFEEFVLQHYAGETG
ncbi:PBIP1 protein, partial [Upupa epops]|nr:PBIP1 protein [Upupa epops]